MNSPEVSLEKLKEDLQQKGVKVDALAVLLVGGGEQVLGEGSQREDGLWDVKNPKRLVRLQQMDRSGQGLSISYLIGDFDMVEGGLMHVRPTGYYLLSEIDVPSQGAVLQLYRDFLVRKVEAKAREAGIVIPDKNIKPAR